MDTADADLKWKDFRLRLEQTMGIGKMEITKNETNDG
jgi:hypothetical protein